MMDGLTILDGDTQPLASACRNLWVALAELLPGPKYADTVLQIRTTDYDNMPLEQQWRGLRHGMMAAVDVFAAANHYSESAPRPILIAASRAAGLLAVGLVYYEEET